MANLNKYDPRVDALAMERRTFWDPDVGDLTPDDRQWLAEEVHAHPELASKIRYERSHTGFTREITVTVDDIARIYESRVSS